MTDHERERCPVKRWALDRGYERYMWETNNGEYVLHSDYVIFLTRCHEAAAAIESGRPDAALAILRGEPVLEPTPEPEPVRNCGTCKHCNFGTWMCMRFDYCLKPTSKPMHVDCWTAPANTEVPHA